VTDDWGRAAETTRQVFVDDGTGHTLTILFSGPGGGSVRDAELGISCASSGDSCATPLPPGYSVLLIAEPAAGSVLGGWAGVDFDGGASGATVSMTGDRTVTVVFNLDP
jgi:hypothetical protein